MTVQSSRKHTGNLGESLASAYLQTQGYTILATNWHCPNGEIDIVAQQGDALVFVEVKTRRAGGLDAAFNSITVQKRQRLIDSAYNYIHDQELEDPLWRIDLIAIALRRGEQPVIDHRENALDW
jgi:putative endonuclease